MGYNRKTSRGFFAFDISIPKDKTLSRADIALEFRETVPAGKNNLSDEIIHKREKLSLLLKEMKKI